MINVNSPAGLNPALLNPLAPGVAANVPAGARQLDATLLIAKQGAGDVLGKVGLTEPNMGRAGPADVAAALAGLNDSVGTDIYAVMALMQKLAQEQRNAARETRAADMTAQVSALQSAADKIQEAAEERFKGALAAGIMQIAGGVAQVGAGMAGIGSSMKAAGLKGIEDPTAAQRTALGKHDGIANNSSGMGQGLSGISGGIGSMIQAGFDRAAGRADADRARLEADAKVAETGVQHANDLMQQMMDVIRDVRDKLGAIEQSRVETNRGIARNI